MRIFYLIFFLFQLASCSGEIKNEHVEIDEEAGTSIHELKAEEKSALQRQEHCLGYYVGDFEPNFSDEDVVDEKYQYDSEFETRTNKINISIDSLVGNTVFGHSVVAGNDRPFKGDLQETRKEKEAVLAYSFKATEPGDHKNDGVFQFTIFPHEKTMVGTWEAFKKERVYKRKFDLSKKEYQYDSLVMLDKSNQFVNWRKSIEQTSTYQVDGEVEEWLEEKYATTTEKIFKINGSKALLKKSDVENLTKGDLEIIRNTIYARHGYSFKNKIYRNFFDTQEWYIPLHADITKELKEIEKKNIQLLMRYEKNAKEYYDHFGR